MTKKRRRMSVIKRWLMLEFPTKHVIMLRVADMPAGYKDCLGTYSGPDGSPNALIRISKKVSISQQIDTLLHEWGHARVDPDAEGCSRWHGGHVNEFYLEYGRIERSFLAALDGVLKPKPTRR